MFEKLIDEKSKLLDEIEERLNRIKEIDSIIDIELEDFKYHLEKSKGDNG